MAESWCGSKKEMTKKSKNNTQGKKNYFVMLLVVYFILFFYLKILLWLARSPHEKEKGVCIHKYVYFTCDNYNSLDCKNENKK